MFFNDMAEVTAFSFKHRGILNGELLFTGLQRTGCMFCMFGCHLEKEPSRFQRMAKTHPTLYLNCIKPTLPNANAICLKCTKENCTACVGLGLGEVLEYIGVDYRPVG